jgi:photosystem II stability/assembly factor-like uncharacterized protein
MMRQRLLGIVLVMLLPVQAALGQRARRQAAMQPPGAAAQAGYDSTLFAGMEWRSIGPFRGGRAVAVTGVRGQPGTYYFGATGGGVWKTEDAGLTWHNVTDGYVKTGSVGAIAVAESDPNVVYVGMGEHPARGVAMSHGDGVYRSTDGGKTWTHVGLELARQISRIRVHPKNPDLVYVAAQGAPFGATKDRGIYRSKDGGKTWEQVLYVSETAGAGDLAMDPTNPRVLYAAFWDMLRRPWEVRSGGPGSGIWKSTDGGDTWKKITDGMPALMGKIGVDVSAADPERVYAIVEADPGGGLFRSDDGGQHWRLTSSNWTIRARAWYYMKVFADPQNADVVYVLDAPAMRSIDGGHTFTNIHAPHGDNHDLWINPDDNQNLANANDGGADISFNGGKTWSTQENQPTAQFYRVNTDNRFPYWVYGGQQDNTTVAIASSAPGGVSWKDWHEVGGCESAFVGFNPDDPRYVYAGCFHGQITEWDATTGQARDVMPYPELPLALPSREMKYRYNWNTPIVVSLHDPNVIYQAANVLFKSTNRGHTWTVISPDLTTNDPAKQGPGGGPITNEGAGGEVYETIDYVMESRQDANTIWTGSDDGLVQVTRDAGKTWTNVTPPGLGEAQINAIETSPFVDGTAYVAATKYKFNDFTPHLFRTTDFGKSWKEIVSGIEPDHWVHVAREDPARRGLLYCGTELGVYLSFDDGDHWQPWQLNLPIVPINDLQIHGNDLVAATQGRAFWILDDLSPVRQLESGVSGEAAHLYKPANAVRVAGGGGFELGESPVGKSAPAGAIVYYNLKSAVDSADTLTLEVRDSAGVLVRRYTNHREPGDSGGQGESGGFGRGAPTVLPAKAGLNRFVWDLRHARPTVVPHLFLFGGMLGRRVVPGHYQVRLTLAGQSQTQAFDVLKDPRIDATPADYLAQDQLLASITGDLNNIHGGVNRLRSVRNQLDDLLKRVKGQPGADSVESVGKALVDKLDAMEDSLVQKKTVDGQTVINFPVRLDFHFIYLLDSVDGADAGVTDGARQRYADLSAQWARLQPQLDSLLGPDLSAFNALVREKGIPVVVEQK